jgi:hypothetical protein
MNGFIKTTQLHGFFILSVTEAARNYHTNKMIVETSQITDVSQTMHNFCDIHNLTDKTSKLG